MNPRIDWSAVRKRVIALDDAERRRDGLGPSPYPVFEPVLTPDEIAEVEAQYGVAIPDEYRAFLAEVGAGGRGPELELTSLRRIGRIGGSCGSWGWVWDDDEVHPWLLDPGGPFVETEDWPAQQAATLRAAGHEPADRGEEEGDAAAADRPDCRLYDYRDAFGEAGDELWYLERGRGAIHISDDGCGMTSWLVLVGPHAGELRHRDCALDPPFEPSVDAQGNRHSFGTWYLEWLERRERAAR